MIRLTTLDGDVLSRMINKVSPIQYSSNKQINKLLDGSYHVQIIGSSLRSIEGTIVATFLKAPFVPAIVIEP